MTLSPSTYYAFFCKLHIQLLLFCEAKQIIADSKVTDIKRTPTLFSNVFPKVSHIKYSMQFFNALEIPAN